MSKIITLNEREENLKNKIEELEREIKERKDKIIVLKNEICKNEFDGHDTYNNNDICRKCLVNIDENVDFYTNLDWDGLELRKIYHELGLEYNEEDELLR